MCFGDAGGRPPVDAFVSAIDYAYAHSVVVVAAAADEDTGTEQGQPANLVQPRHRAEPHPASRLVVTSADFFDGPSGAGHGSEISIAAYGSFGALNGGRAERHVRRLSRQRSDAARDWQRLERRAPAV